MIVRYLLLLAIGLVVSSHTAAKSKNRPTKYKKDKNLSKKYIHLVKIKMEKDVLDHRFLYSPANCSQI